MTASDPVTMVGGYVLVSRLGEGGMGVVYLAQDRQGSPVAVKLLRPHVVSDESGRARMAREVTSLRRVRSPLVAHVYDADPWGHVPYLVTRYVPGPSLHDRVKHGGPLSGPALETVASGLAHALVAVHGADVLHRDVKPSNVLLEGPVPVLIDFGLAQLADDSRITHSGWLLGTPGYLAPEILFGDDPTPLADVHSWAATVVYAATGRGPYGNGPAVAVMDRVRRGEHDLSGVPDSLYWVLRQALSADPRDRPSSWQLADWLSTGQVGSAGSSTAPPVGLASGPLTMVAETKSPPAAAGSWSSGTPFAGSGPATNGSSAAAPVKEPAGPQAEAGPGTASGATAWPAQRRRPSPVVATLFWTGISLLLVEGAVAAPALAAAVLVGLSWLLSTLSVRGDQVWRWRLRRGPRRGDGLLATLCTPWFSLVALPGALVNAGFAVLSGAAAVVVATMALPPRTLVYVLAMGGGLASVLAWCGPFSRDVRAGGRSVSSVLLQPGMTTLLVLLAIVAAGVAILLTRQIAGPAYAPFPSPPWRHLLRDALP